MFRFFCQKKSFLLVFAVYQCLCSSAQSDLYIMPAPVANGIEKDTLQPLDQISFDPGTADHYTVSDANGITYLQQSSRLNHFTISGAAGIQHIYTYDKKNRLLDSLEFLVSAKTIVDDGGYYRDMFQLFYKGMLEDNRSGYYNAKWNAENYKVFVGWVLDNYYTMQGKQYFLPYGDQLIDMMRKTQRDDGMIYSNIGNEKNMQYFLTRDKFSGYSQQFGDRVFVRQPVENHPEFLYVNTIYDCWKAKGDDMWMKAQLSSANQALNYALNDPARFSKRFGLLKRVYTIDSWDFAVEDEYLPDLGVTNTMIIDPDRSKFGIFFGDNTGYITACNQLAEMYAHSGDESMAVEFRDRAKLFRERLNALAWNGHFYTHFIEEDSTVKRNLGVDEKSQLAQSNAYSLNRDIDTSQKKAIIESYQELSKNLPAGSPGEWYSIYPPFERGFEKHNAKWQYMNGGVGGHVAGELALGALNYGYEDYGRDILERLFELGKKYGHKIWFSYTGASEPPAPTAHFKPLNLQPFANMDREINKADPTISWMGSQRTGDDFANLPRGGLSFDGVPYHLIDPATNNRKAVLAVSEKKNYPARISIPVNDTATSLYILHTASKPVSAGIVGAVRLQYADGSNSVQYISMEKDLAYWWFSSLKTDRSGIAWKGKNEVSEGIGLSWCNVPNPEPGKMIKSIELEAAKGGPLYTVFAITLSDQPIPIPVKPWSYGGPDDWAAATAMSALIKGLVGVDNSPGTESLKEAWIAPRWAGSKTDSVATCVHFSGTNNYLSYFYANRKAKREIILRVAGSGEKRRFHVELPESAKPANVMVNGRTIEFSESEIGETNYADFNTSGPEYQEIVIRY